MRHAATILVVVVAALAARKLYALHTAWSVTLAILVAGGMFATCAIVLRNTPRSSARRARGSMPADPGIPKPPLPAPYR